jgi:hypothetical protein
MKNMTLTVAVLGVAALAVACNKPAEQPSKTATEQIEQAKSDTKDAAQDMKDYAYSEKTEFVAKMEVRLAGINRELDELSAKIEKASDTAKAEAKPKLQALREQADLLGKQLDTVKASTESSWGDVKAGFKKGYGEFKDGVAKARQWASDKIAP